MARPQIISEGFTLVGWPTAPYKPSAKDSTATRTAALLRVNNEVIQDLQRCTEEGKVIRLLAGRSPRLQYDNKSYGFSIDQEKFTHELYTSTSSQSNSLRYAASVTQTAVIEATSNLSQDSASTDAALASLRQSLASHKQEKESKQATISTSVIPSNKANKILSNRYVSNPARPSSQANSPLVGSTKAPPAPTSAPNVNALDGARIKAMTHALLHLVASQPISDDKIHKLTHISNPYRHDLLSKIAEFDTEHKKWKLKEKHYRELDVWRFPYPSSESRDEAIDSAIRAFDRLRLGKDDKLWQLLLPEKERGKGKCLSRLLGQHLNATQARKSPNGAASPAFSHSGEASTANGRLTPNPASTPLTSKNSTNPIGKGMTIEKRLKESQKQRALEEAKEAKRKDKGSRHNEAMTKMNLKSEKATAAANKISKMHFKSDAVVRSSDDDSDEETKGTHIIRMPAATKIQARPAHAGSPDGTSSSDGKPLMRNLTAGKEAAKASPKVKVNQPVTVKKTPQTQHVNGKRTPVTSSRSPAPPRDDAKAAPSNRPVKHPNPETRPLRSPQKPDAKVKAPSPAHKSNHPAPSLFGNHEKSPAVVRRAANTAAPQAVNTPISNSAAKSGTLKKRPAPDAGDQPDRARKVAKAESLPAAKKTAPAPARTGEDGFTLKRKANDISSNIHDNDGAYIAKHRRTESSSTRSVALSSSSSTSNTTTARTSIASPSPPFAVNGLHRNGWQRSPSNASTASSDPSRPSHWERALDSAESFQKLYPRYIKLHEKMQALKAGDFPKTEMTELWELHDRLKGMKRDIGAAAGL